MGFLARRRIERWLRELDASVEAQVGACRGAEREWWLGVFAAVREAAGTSSVQADKLAGAGRSAYPAARALLKGALEEEKVPRGDPLRLFGPDLSTRAAWALAPLDPSLALPTPTRVPDPAPTRSLHRSDEEAAERAAERLLDGRFEGASGIRRLRQIITILEGHEDLLSEMAEAKAQLASLLSSSAPPGDVLAAYRDAYATAVAAGEQWATPGDALEDVYDEAASVLGDWMSWAADRGDAALVWELLTKEIPRRGSQVPTWILVRLVRRLHEGGDEEATEVGGKLATFVAERGQLDGAAEIVAASARALYEGGRTEEALVLCRKGGEKGWMSRELANRWSLVLERERRFEEAAEVCVVGLTVVPADEQIAKRLDRCRAKAARSGSTTPSTPAPTPLPPLVQAGTPALRAWLGELVLYALERSASAADREVEQWWTGVADRAKAAAGRVSPPTGRGMRRPRRLGYAEAARVIDAAISVAAPPATPFDALLLPPSDGPRPAVSSGRTTGRRAVHTASDRPGAPSARADRGATTASTPPLSTAAAISPRTALARGVALGAGTFVGLDFETATSSRDTACALGMARVVDGSVTEVRRWLIRPPENRYDGQNIAVHGITPSLTEHAPPFPAVWEEALDFVDGHPIVAHFAVFDIGVLRASVAGDGASWPPLTYLCTWVLSKRCWPGRLSYRLDDLAAQCGVDLEHHEPGSDAAAAGMLAVALCGAAETPSIIDAGAHFGAYPGHLDTSSWSACGVTVTGRSGERLSALRPSVDVVPTDHPLSGKTVVFTGTLALFARHDAAQAVVNVGGRVMDNMSRKVDYLVCGVQDAAKVRDGVHSTKMLRAIELQAEGAAIELLDEVELYRMLHV